MASICSSKKRPKQSRKEGTRATTLLSPSKTQYTGLAKHSAQQFAGFLDSLACEMLDASFDNIFNNVDVGHRFRSVNENETVVHLAE